MGIAVIAMSLAGQGPLALASSTTYCGTTAGPAGGYQVNPDGWNLKSGDGGTFCIQTDGGADFTISTSTFTSGDLVTANAPGGYANIGTGTSANGLPIKVSNLGDSTSSWTTSTGGITGMYDVAYDIWYNTQQADCLPASGGTSYELMIWINENNRPITTNPNNKPLGSVTLGGSLYNVYKQTGAPHSLIMYDLATHVSSVTNLNVRLFTQDALARGYAPASGYLCNVSAGFEVWPTVGDDQGAGARTKSFGFVPEASLPSGRVSSGISDQCLSDRLGLSGDDNPVQEYSCNQNSGQAWTINNDGTVQVYQKCLDTAGDGTSSGTKVTIDTCDGDAQQQWQTGANHSLVNLAANKCLQNPGSPGFTGYQLQIEPCDGSQAQMWIEPFNGNPPVGRISPVSNASSCLDNKGGNTSDGNPIDLITCPSGYQAEVSWTLADDGTLQVQGKCMDLTSAQNGAWLQACNGAQSQQWVINPTTTSGTSAQLVNLQTGSCLAASGTAIQVNACNGASAQNWYLPAT